MSRYELACLAIGLLFVGIGALAWGLRKWRDDLTNEEFWP